MTCKEVEDTLETVSIDITSLTAEFCIDLQLIAMFLKSPIARGDCSNPRGKVRMNLDKVKKALHEVVFSLLSFWMSGFFDASCKY